MVKNFKCPFCMEGFNSRVFLLNQHIPRCDIREKYFNKILDIAMMNEIYKRIHNEILDIAMMNEIYKRIHNDREVEYIETENFKGNVIKE